MADIKVQKCAVLLNQNEVTTREMRCYFEKNWDELTAHLQNATILFLSGRHGLEDGSIGPQDDNVMIHQREQVR